MTTTSDAAHAIAATRERLSGYYDPGSVEPEMPPTIESRYGFELVIDGSRTTSRRSTSSPGRGRRLRDRRGRRGAQDQDRAEREPRAHRASGVQLLTAATALVLA
jgi:hypothetical protein